MRFMIRDVLWLTVVVALGLGWLIDRSRLTTEVDNTVALMQSELERVEREYDAAWEKALAEMLERTDDKHAQKEPAAGELQ